MGSAISAGGEVMTVLPTLEDIRSDFELLDDWEDRYRYVIELGRALPSFPEALRTEANKVRGCASQVWLATEIDDRKHLQLQGDSDAHIVRGLIAILFAIHQGKSATDVLATDTHAIFGDLGLNEHLTPQRSNGLASMVARLKRDAEAAGASV